MTVPRKPFDPKVNTSTIALSINELTSNAPSFVLVVMDGPDKGAKHVVDGTSPSRVLIGKSPSCEIRLSDPAVSRRHASLYIARGRLRMTDLESTNGTFVNGISVVDGYLDGGEFLRLGSTTFHVQLEEVARPAKLSPRTAFGRLVGSSEAMRRLYPLCEKLADSDVPLVIEGETGTGKEVLAESIHAMSTRADGPFVVFDCVATPPNLLESILFGHEKGAFTGATSSRAGVFERAHKGTLLIDEIGDLDLSLQPKLLRAIQNREVQRVGRAEFTKVDVRVIAATRRDLDREVQAGRFRDDLFFRLNVARIELPPLRDRTGDITVLAKHFWDTLGGAGKPMPPDLLQRFEDYPWPGNIRELHNAVARHLALGEFADFRIESRSSASGSEAPPPPLHGMSSPVPDFLDQVLAKSLVLADARELVLDEFERRYVEHALRVHGGNVTRAAASAGVARRYFHVLRTKRTHKDE
ncbi:MAG: sigma 54-dependent Fis family transcriptional regulator [Deltaproteobacteria bacterium]|nr:sigma 54-dependent Fis family transcriptional regulator [Deltaproteobacteria bacterium]